MTTNIELPWYKSVFKNIGEAPKPAQASAVGTDIETRWKIPSLAILRTLSSLGSNR
jgi:hypothetical protein